ncbi:isoprenyl transferase [Christensenellaceae bacterium 44-20]
MVKQELLEKYGLDRDSIPGHVAIIMDGNGRWAKARHMPRTYGHKKGAERVKEIVRLSSDLGVNTLTLYAFSTENWKRPKEEVGLLMGLIIEYLRKELRELWEENVRFYSIGDRQTLPSEVRAVIEESEAETKENTGLNLVVAINYGGQDELVQAAKRLAEDFKAGKTELNQQAFEDRFYTAGLPAVDYVIRTSGELRMSNFLPYQAAYAELCFTQTLWPDFDAEKYVQALREYAGRNRRFGGI